MKKKLLESIFVGCFILSFMGFATAQNAPSNTPAYYDNQDQYLVDVPDRRAKNPESYFSKERKFLENRRKQNGLPEPKFNDGDSNVVGLAFSGGGIRSNAFQLGFMSGLAKIGFLNRVDYISAVSGGSWAAGAYKSSPKEDAAFFKALNEVVNGGDYQETNDPKTRPLFNSYEEALKGIWTTKLDLAHHRVGFRTQENWRKMLRTNVLNCMEQDPKQCQDIKLKDLDLGPMRDKRPFIIINATHDANFYSQGESRDYNFSFELTSSFVGTIADCGNKPEYCSIWDSMTGGQNGIFTSTKHEGLTPLTLSYAMAMSGAVSPNRIGPISLNILDWKLEIPRHPDRITQPVVGPQYTQANSRLGAAPGEVNNDSRGEYAFIKKIHRDDMVITDGGHSDNLGLFALIERHVPRIVVTDVAYDPGHTYDDLNVTRHHAAELLKMDISESKEGRRVDDAEETGTYYYCSQDPAKNVTDKWKDSTATKNNAVCEEKNSIGKILYIKPTKYSAGFKKYLSKQEPDVSHIRIYLDVDLDHNYVDFPTDKTFAHVYNYDLIFSYYLLGRYFATEVLNRKLEDVKWKEKTPAGNGDEESKKKAVD